MAFKEKKTVECKYLIFNLIKRTLYVLFYSDRLTHLILATLINWKIVLRFLRNYNFNFTNLNVFEIF